MYDDSGYKKREITNLVDKFVGRYKVRPQTQYLAEFRDMVLREGLTSNQVNAIFEESLKRLASFPSLKDVYKIMNDWGWNYRSKEKKSSHPQSLRGPNGQCVNCDGVGLVKMLATDGYSTMAVCNQCSKGSQIRQKFTSRLHNENTLLQNGYVKWTIAREKEILACKR